MTPPSSNPQVFLSRAASTEVLTNFQLYPTILEFLPGQPGWLTALEKKRDPVIDEIKLRFEARKGAGTPGLLPFLAIQQRDMRALQRLWILHKQSQFRKAPKFWFHSAMHDAATIGNLEALQWLHTASREICKPSAVSLAAMDGHTDVVRWLLIHLPDFDLESAQRAMIKAATNGRLSVLKAFYEWRKDACTSQMMDLAAASGHLEVVQFLHEHGGAGCSTDAVDSASENGHLDVVKWLLENRSEGFTQAALRGAVTKAHLSVVQYLWETHCRRDGPDENFAMFTEGMRAGVPHIMQDKNLKMLRFLHEYVGQDAFPQYALSLAAEKPRHRKVFRFMHSLQRPREDIDLALRRAVLDRSFTEYLLAHETFSLEVLEDTLWFAQCLNDKTAVAASIMALQIAIAQKKQTEADEGTNCFAPVVPMASTAVAQRAKHKSRRPVARATARPPRTQAFLSLESAPDASGTDWTRRESSPA